MHKPNNKKKKHAGDGPLQSSKNGDNKRFKGKCYNCNKVGHRVVNCRLKNKDQGSSTKKFAQANVTEWEKLSNGVADINLSAMVSEANLVRNTKEWWVDTGPTRHICPGKTMFTTYNVVANGEQLYMGNSSSSKVVG